MTFLENELIKMFGKNETLTDIRCVGNSLIGGLSENTIAKISFRDNQVKDNYTSVLMQVINPKSGEVDRQSIKFDDVFCRSACIYDCGGSVFWQNFKPEKQDYEKINLAAEQYFEMFLEPVQDIRLRM